MDLVVINNFVGVDMMKAMKLASQTHPSFNYFITVTVYSWRGVHIYKYKRTPYGDDIHMHFIYENQITSPPTH